MEESKCGCCRWCCCSKEDFFPEESFKSWKSYGNALKETKSRLTDRFLARSQDEEEVNQMRARSKNEMKKSLTWWDLLWFGIGSVMGAGIFVLTGQEANGHAGPAVVLSFAVSGFAALLSVFCYTEFAVDIPVAGGSFAYIRVELGDFVAFVAAVAAVQDLYKTLNYPSQLIGWKSDGGDPCEEPWKGISCFGSSIIYIQLSGLDIGGYLGGQLGNLLSLKQL